LPTDGGDAIHEGAQGTYVSAALDLSASAGDAACRCEVRIILYAVDHQRAQHASRNLLASD